MSSQVWITPDILGWTWRPESSTTYGGDFWRRPYEHWQHADHLLSDLSSEFVRTDVLTTLKRAIDHRVRTLMGLYDLRGLPLSDAPSEHLELLALVGLVRPRMVRNLLDLRNAVEHEDAPPPSEDDCRVLSEFTWYFIKSTDRVVRSVVDSIHAEPHGLEQDDMLPHHYGARITMGLENRWIPEVMGRLRADWISNEARIGWLTVRTKRVETGAEFINRLRTSKGMDFRMAEISVETTDTFIQGEIRGPGDALRTMYSQYFDLS